MGIDERGCSVSRRTLRHFKFSGRNRGRVPWDEQFSFDSDERRITSFSDYQQLPHAGVLSTQAWLARYPSTDTNRNRARARWTYFHFLGVDIEKSAPRTTDPDALADTNNPRCTHRENEFVLRMEVTGLPAFAARGAK